MKIVVNDIAASGGGALTVLRDFYSYVRENPGDHEWTFLLSADLLDETSAIRTVIIPEAKKSWLRRLLFDFFTGRRIIAGLNPDALFSLQNTYTYGLKCPQVIYVHQSLPFQNEKKYSFFRSEERLLAVYQHLIGALIKQSVRRASHVIVQTQWMREAILTHANIDGSQIDRVAPSIDDLTCFREEGPFDTGAFFYPTAEQSYKNNQCAIEACRLLLRQGVQSFTLTMTTAASSGLGPFVQAIGRIPRASVMRRLARSTLVFPSLIETYGLPLAEARALGCIVLAADLPYAREVLKDYVNAYFFDPYSPIQLAQLMRRVIEGDIRRISSNPEPVHTSSWISVVNIIEARAREHKKQL